MSKTLRTFEGTTTDYSVHGLVEVPMGQPAPEKPAKAARELAASIQGTISVLQLVLERVATATKRGLDDSAGAQSGGGMPVTGTRDFTQAMLNKMGGGGSKDVKDDEGNLIRSVPVPIERDDDIRKSLATLVAAVGAASDWAERARVETFRLTPLTLEKAKAILGEGPTQCLNPNHDRDIWNTPQDRPRAGRCEACYRYWDKHDRKEERPRSLCHPEERKESA